MPLPPYIANAWHRVIHPAGHRYLRHKDGRWFTPSMQEVEPPTELAPLVLHEMEDGANAS